MTRVLPRTASLLLSLGSSTLVAQRDATDSLPRVPISVESMATGGRWQTEKAAGYYRAVGFSNGWEEIRHRVFLEWIREPDTKSLDSVVARVDLTGLAAAYGLAEPKLIKRGKLWALSVKASATQLTAYKQTIVFELGPPGKVRRIRDP